MSPPIEDDTLSATDTESGPSDRSRCPHLFLVLESHRPLLAPVRVALDGLDEVVLGRGSARAIEHDRDGGVRRVRVRLDDGWLSTRHARLTRVLRRWVLEDTGSKNGCFVDGVRRSQAELADGALIELGHAFFLYRDDLPHAPDAPPVVDAGALAAPAQAFVTLSPQLARTFERLAVVARSRVPVLLEGQTGTGKEVIARAIHDISQRAGPFVAVNCGALPRDLLEAELFGHRKGAFSGATEERPGLVRAADGGTLLLDEIGDLPALSQAALLRVLQEHEVRPVGGTRPVQVDLRVVAATHRSLDGMVDRGDFRADLLARLAGHRMELPPLSARREDMGLLLTALIRRADPSLAARLQIQPAAMRAMLRYGWPANVRELEQCVTRALLLAHEGGRIELDHLPEAVRRAPAVPAAARQDDEDESRRSELVTLLRQHSGNVTAVARAMGKARMQIQRWLKRYDIDPESFRR
ncbi:MAG TPA: sigma 54-interacting transcriptional regulator [Kofleriaceae bacterium]|nr:sigma 54-interacting transcriptional regulator [Kofleriaceae bacterium]